MFNLKAPCANCPFRKDEGAIDLAPGRLEQIIKDIENEEVFFCHKYLSGEETLDESGDIIAYKSGKGDQCCAGAIIYIEKKYGEQRCSALQVAKRLGWLPIKLMREHFDKVIDPPPEAL